MLLIRNNQGRGKCNQPRPKAEAYYTCRDLRGRGHFFIFFLMSSILSFNPNSDFSKFASAVYHYNIFRYIENKENKGPFFASSQTVTSHFSKDNRILLF